MIKADFSPWRMRRFWAEISFGNGRMAGGLFDLFNSIIKFNGIARFL
jgi:hypothetical protein